MKTTLLLTIFHLIAWNAISQSDSVTLSREVANEITRELRDCDLAKLKLEVFYETDSLKSLEITALKEQKEILNRQLKRQKAWYNRKGLWFAVGVVVGGFTVNQVKR